MSSKIKFAEIQIEEYERVLQEGKAAIKTIDKDMRCKLDKLSKSIRRQTNKVIYFSPISFVPKMAPNKSKLYVYLHVYTTAATTRISRQIRKRTRNAPYSRTVIEKYIQEHEYDIVHEAYAQIREIEEYLGTISSLLKGYRELHSQLESINIRVAAGAKKKSQRFISEGICN